jgi:hypothetical protein
MESDEAGSPHSVEIPSEFPHYHGDRINMVMRYAHPTQEHQTQAMEKMSQYVAQQQIAAAEQIQPITPVQ